MKRFLIFWILVICSTISASEIKNVIVCDDSTRGRAPYIVKRPFMGTFKIENMPAPKSLSKVSYDLEVINSIGRYYDEDWKLGISYSLDGIEITDHTNLHWPGPHKNGDRFSGSFTFKTIKSGEWRLGVFIDQYSISEMRPGWGAGINFEFCIDQDGILHSMQKYNAKTDRCYDMRTVYFDNDTLRLDQLKEHKGRNSLNYEVKIFPKPYIGDTSEVVIELMANEFITSDIEYLIHSAGIEVVSVDNFLITPIDSLDSGSLVLKIVPQAVNYHHSLNINMTTPYEKGVKGKQYAITQITMVFNNDRTLKYANLSGSLNTPKSALPTNFREFNQESDRKTIKLMSDGQLKKISR